jgi:hypothetical protein
LGKDTGIVTECIALIRDPVDRWISGFATYATGYLLGYGYGSDYFVEDYNNLTERVIFDTLVFDDHTTEQVKFVSQIDFPNTTYFKLNKTYIQDIANYLQIDLVTTDNLQDNNSENNYDVKQISQFMRDRVEQDPALKEKIIRKYQCDYELIRTAKFYDPR